MAKANTNATSDFVETDDTVVMSKARRDVALETTWEIDKLSQVISGIVPLGDDQNFFAVRGIAARIKELAIINMRCLEGECQTRDLGSQLRIENNGTQGVAE